MHARAQSNNLSPWQRKLVELLAEQGAVPFDQLVRYLGCECSRLERSLRSLDRRGWVKHRRFLPGDARWFWLSRRGVRFAGGAHRYTVPIVRSLPHRRAINETRLFLEGREPAGQWVSERATYAADPTAEHVPDGVFEFAGERHAIEVELSRKSRRELIEILDQHSSRYDAVIYLCGPGTFGPMKRLQAEGRWPKLHVRRLPEEASRC